jgi:predicted hydrolase (HD superfamily)
MKSITSPSLEIYLIKPRRTESPQHIFLIKDISNYLKTFTNNVKTYRSVKPDIVFRINRKEYAIEVETGKILRANKKAIVKKVKSLNKKYKDNWFFVVTDKNLTSQYNKLGKTCDRRYLASIISRIARKK